MKDPYERLVILLMEQEDNPMEDEQSRRRKENQDRFNDPKVRKAELEARAAELEDAISQLGGSNPRMAREREELKKQLDQIKREINTQIDLGRGKGLGRLTRLKSAVVGGGTTYLGIIQNFLRNTLGAGKSRIPTNVLASPG